MPTDILTPDAWLALVASAPTEADRRDVLEGLALWLIDEADRPEEAEAVRWMVRTGLWPDSRERRYGVLFCYWRAYGAHGPVTCRLCKQIFERLEGWSERRNAQYAYYDEISAALSALIAAYVAARRAGWEPSE